MFDSLIDQNSTKAGALQEEIKKLHSQSNQLVCIRKGWPDAVPEPAFCVAQTDEWWFRIDVDTETDAKVIMERMNPVNLYMVQDGWQRFTPEYRIDLDTYPLAVVKVKNRHTRQLGLPYFYVIGRMGKEHSLVFWVLINTQPCRIEVRIAERSGDKYMTADIENTKHHTYYSGARAHDRSGEFDRHWIPTTGSADTPPTAYLYKEG